MQKKSLILWISVILAASIFSYSLVFGSSIGFSNTPTTLYYKNTSNIFLEHGKLNTAKFIFQSWRDISDFSMVSTCETSFKFLEKRNKYYFFSMTFNGNSCNDRKVYLKKWAEILYSGKLNILSENKLYSKILDLPTEKLKEIQEKINQKIAKHKSKINTNISNSTKNLLQRNISELLYTRAIFSNIIDLRNQRYFLPVQGYWVPTRHSKIPNSWRPYRSSYTDWIHHGWDIGSKKWEEIIALDDAQVVRVVDWFVFEDLNTLKKWKNLTEMDKVKNLDILRGNQVWLKTMKWDVVFYSHLTDIYDHIKEGTIIRKWEPVGTIWSTGVPDRNYKDFHLHFTIHKNPYNEEKAWKYDYDDYMNWPWYYKWQPASYIFKNQKNLFMEKQ